MALLAVLAVPAMGFAGDGIAQAESEDRAETAPGEQLAGVVGVQGAELDGDLDQRSFGAQLAQATDNETRADVVAERVGVVEERLDELRERKATLEEQREAGEISEGKYRADVAKVEAEIRMLSHAINQTGQAADGLPPGLLEDRGVDASAIQDLQQNASELSGPEVAEIARGVAGPAVGEPPGQANATGPPANATGPPTDNSAGEAPGNQSAGPDGSGDAPGDAPGDDSEAGDTPEGNQSAGPDNPGDAPDDAPGDDPEDDDSSEDDADE